MPARWQQPTVTLGSAPTELPRSGKEQPGGEPPGSRWLTPSSWSQCPRRLAESWNLKPHSSSWVSVFPALTWPRSSVVGPQAFMTPALQCPVAAEHLHGLLFIPQCLPIVICWGSPDTQKCGRLHRSWYVKYQLHPACPLGPRKKVGVLPCVPQFMCHV